MAKIKVRCEDNFNITGYPKKSKLVNVHFPSTNLKIWVHKPRSNNRILALYISCKNSCHCMQKIHLNISVKSFYDMIEV